jgi:hypothetical protein
MAQLIVKIIGRLRGSSDSVAVVTNENDTDYTPVTFNDNNEVYCYSCNGGYCVHAVAVRDRIDAEKSHAN